MAAILLYMAVIPATSMGESKRGTWAVLDHIYFKALEALFCGFRFI